MFRTVTGNFGAFLLAGTLFVLPSSSLGDDPIVSAEEIAYGLAPTRGLAITAAQPTSVNLPMVTFEFNSFRLTAHAERQLDEVGKALNMQAFQSSKFVIVGHTDAVGGESYNQRLSEQRAESVVSYLVTRQSLNRDRLSAVGWGESRLLPNVPPDSTANRRVEVRNIGNGQ
jgi:outer membrane protein OmpA-like peptidoglycan-associated protein